MAAEESTVTVGNFWGAADDVVPPNGETKEEWGNAQATDAKNAKTMW